MKEGGRIINIGSCNADRMPFAGGAVYAMSKSALLGLVQGLPRDLGGRGITINNIQPGPVDTEMNPPTASSLKCSKSLWRSHGTARLTRLQPWSAYLAGPEAAFITGASLTIDGGFSA